MLDLDSLYERYDKDGSRLLSAKEISQMCSDMNMELDEAEI